MPCAPVYCAINYLNKPMVFTPENLLNHLNSLSNFTRYVIAYSGGLDSTVLLHALASNRQGLNAALQAVHIHHGLQSEADTWCEHCEQFCTKLNIPHQIFWVNARHNPGESPEAAARHARYNALHPLISSRTCLLTAQHQDDQAETLLLQLLRGAGPKGLAAMPSLARFSDGHHARPLLTYTRAELMQYAKDKQLLWIDDPSNFDIGYDRNLLRHHVIPQLKRRWPSSSRVLSRVAGIQAETAKLCSALADIDRSSAAGSRPNTLSIISLKRLSKARQNNLLRHWIHTRGLPVPSSTQLARVDQEMIDARPDSTPLLHWPGAELRRYRDDLYAIPPLLVHETTQEIPWDLREDLPIPHLGVTLKMQTLKAQGLNLQPRQHAAVIRFRRGGERCQPKGRSHHHALKKLFQDSGVPPWERDRIPLIYVDEQLVAVWGYWVCG